MTAEAITTAVTTIMTLAGDVMDTIAGNTLFLTLFSGSLVTLACGVVRKLKKTAKA